VVVNPGHVILLCAATSFPLWVYSVDTGQHITGWDMYNADSTLVCYTMEPLDWTVPAGPCEGEMYALIYLPEDATSVDPLPTPQNVRHEGCGKMITWRPE
jgi:hypothetical protein